MVPTPQMRRFGQTARLFGAFALATLLSTVSTGSANAQSSGLGASALRRLAEPAEPTVTQVSAKSRNSGGPTAAPGKPNAVGTFGDWGVYVSQTGKVKVCYALAQPKDRSPASLKRDSAYVFISSRPGEGVRNEVSIIMGLSLKEGISGAKAELGGASFDLVTKGQNAFVKNAAEETQFVAAAKKKGARLVVKVPPAKGPLVVDTYSLAGLAQALDRVGQECQ